MYIYHSFGKWELQFHKFTTHSQQQWNRDEIEIIRLWLYAIMTVWFKKYAIDNSKITPLFRFTLLYFNQ